MTLKAVDTHLQRPRLTPFGGLYTVRRRRHQRRRVRARRRSRPPACWSCPAAASAPSLTNGVRISFGPLVHDTATRSRGPGSPRHVDGELTEFLDFAVETARLAGRQALAHYQTGVAIERKADRSVVTIADRAAEQLIRQRIAARFPDHAIVGEEFGADSKSRRAHGSSIPSTAPRPSSAACRSSAR